MSLYLMTAAAAIRKGDKATALVALQGALRLANRAKRRDYASRIMRAMNHTRAIKSVAAR
jgi:hypothetical protein